MMLLDTPATTNEKSAVATIWDHPILPAEVSSLHDAPLSCDTHGDPLNDVAAIFVKSADTQMPCQFLLPAAVIWVQVDPSSSDWYSP